MRTSLMTRCALAVAVAGCGDGGGGDPGPDAGAMDGGGGTVDGESVYAEPRPSGNTFACATCHALSEPADDGFRRAGHPLGDATRRPTYKNGRLSSMREAVNTCLTEWMNAEPWSEGNPQWQALRAFLDERAPSGEAEPVSIEVVEPPGELGGGDVGAGQTLFDGSCAICHGEGATGTVRAPELAGGDYTAEYIARRVRTSGRTDSPTYDGLTGGRMPFWGADRLSDDELRDLIAYVQSLEEAADGGVPDDAGMPDAGPTDSGVRAGCEATEPEVGQVAELTTRFHNVQGTVTIVDNCTLRIDDFHYDGRGITVEVYGGIDGDYGSGFAMSDNLVRPDPYEGETLWLTLPDGRTLDDFNGVSVWCKDARVSFGDGMFSEP